MNILVFGAGSLGSLIGGLLARTHSVTLVGRDPHIQVVNDAGLRVTGLDEFMVHPQGRTVIPNGEFDLGIVTVKSYDTPAAARALSSCGLDSVVSLQNGMGNETHLAEHLTCPVLAGTTTYGALLESPGVVACTGVGSVTLGPFNNDGVIDNQVGAAFRAASIETTVFDNMIPYLWEKLAINAGINPVTAVTRVDNGALSSGPAWEVARQATVETVTVAREHHVDLQESRVVDSLASVISTTAENTSSMRRDVENGNLTEIDAINGYVVDSANSSVPVNSVLTSLIRGWETGHGFR